MCRPDIREDLKEPLIKKTKTTTTAAENSSSSCCRKISIFTILIIFVVFPMSFIVLLSEICGGWTTLYTSGVRFSTTRDIPDLTGQVAIVTGANTGIGYISALELARHNATVIVASRNPSKGQNAVVKIQQELGIVTTTEGEEHNNDRRVKFIQLDLNSLSSVSKFVDEFNKLGSKTIMTDNDDTNSNTKNTIMPLHILLNNAGIMKSPGAKFIGQNLTYGYSTTVDGFESHIGVNHIGHFYLTMLLVDNLKLAAANGNGNGARVVQVASNAEQNAYDNGVGFVYEDWLPTNNDGIMPESYEDGCAYGQSKLANILFVKELSKRLQKQSHDDDTLQNITAYSCHPGVIQTDLFLDLEQQTNDDLLKKSWFEQQLAKVFGTLFSHSMMSPQVGAMNQLYLATASPEDDSNLVNGGYYTPIGRLSKPIHPAVVSADSSSDDDELLITEAASKLWEETINALRKVNIDVPTL